jgi:hypothetical protein
VTKYFISHFSFSFSRTRPCAPFFSPQRNACIAVENAGSKTKLKEKQFRPPHNLLSARERERQGVSLFSGNRGRQPGSPIVAAVSTAECENSSQASFSFFA